MRGELVVLIYTKDAMRGEFVVLVYTKDCHERGIGCVDVH
jgi:hypothetical protein